MKKKVIVFDLDGVIFDTMPLVAALHQSEYPGLSHDYVKELYKGNIHEKLSAISHMKSKEDITKTYKEYQFNKRQAPIFEGMKELITDLAKEHHLVINTSAFADNCVPLLAREGLDGHFSFIASKEVSPSKVEKFKIISEKFGHAPHEISFVTDTIGDLVEARVVGVPTVLVTWGLHGRGDVEGETYENLRAIVDTVKELREQL